MIGRTAKTVLRNSRQKARPPRKVCPFCFEADHIGGRNHIPNVTVDICQRHHVQLTEERLAAHGNEEATPPDQIRGDGSSFAGGYRTRHRLGY